MKEQHFEPGAWHPSWLMLAEQLVDWSKSDKENKQLAQFGQVTCTIVGFGFLQFKTPVIVQNITSGYRLCLAYRLAHTNR